ncbi:MAG: DNA topoisomerase 3 [Bacteroidales bacterium]|nr:DNA topoisomerase 3 [Bacteroidales bacterium]
MIVCIAEKPSVAREIAEVLGAKTRKDGYLEGNGYQVTWTFGHLCTLKEPADYTPQWKQWGICVLPMIPQRFGIKLIENETYKRQFETIKGLFLNADMIVNCGDAGQEGELIQRWVLQMSGAKCPVKRLWISSLTEESIREGFNNLKDQSEFQGLYESGLSRSIGDWILGMNATRLYTLRFSDRSSRQILSIGRVQTPTLALIVNRQREIDHFVSTPYWELRTTYRDTVFQSEKGKFETQAEGEDLLAKVAADAFTIVSATDKKGKEAPPKLFDLTSLQVECNKKMGLSAERTLQIAQTLYERKFTTYPRVDTTYLSDDIYPKVPATLKGISGQFGELVQPLLGAKLPKSKKVFDNSKVTDHHAIIPTGVPASGLGPEEMRVYEMISMRFIAAFYPDCEVSTRTVIGKAAGISFKTSGKQILKPGWHEVFAKEEAAKLKAKAEASQNEPDGEKDETAAPEEKILPNFTIGESGPHEPFLKETWTTAPKPYTEATLLRAMETAGKFVDSDELREAMKENGIGRPSTRAAIIETLFKRNYIRKERKSLYPTQTGKELIATIQNELLKSAELTGIWENKLRKIEKGQYSAKEFLDELKAMTSDLVDSVLKMKDADMLSCPHCGKGQIIRGRTAYGCSRYREGCTFLLPYSEYGTELSDDQLAALLKKNL